MSGRPLTEAEIAFVMRVASRRFGASDAVVSAPSVAVDGGRSPFFRAAALAGAAARNTGAGSRTAALLLLCCQLSADGYTLMAPQGAAAGMIAGLTEGRMDIGAVARWVEDRSIPGPS